MTWILKPAGLVEPVPAPEFFVDGVGAIEESNGLLRLFYYANRTSLYSDEMSKQVEVVVRMPMASVGGGVRDAVARWQREQRPKYPFIVR